MEDEQLVDAVIALVGQLMQAAGPEQTLQFLQNGLAAAQEGGGEQPMPADMPPEVMSQGGPGAMPPAAPMPAKRGMMGKRIN